MDGFESQLLVAQVNSGLELLSIGSIEWADFFLNPRRLRGSDFLMRWSQGVWSEERILHMLNQTADYHAIPYGPSGTAPEDIREYELYFERLDAAGLGKIKRPDILVFRKRDMPFINQTVTQLGGLAELPFIPETEPSMRDLLQKAVVAVECENSLWKARQMPGYGKPLTPQKRLHGQMGLSRSTVVPTIILKEEDRQPLAAWQVQNSIPIHIWHVFYDIAIGIAFDNAQNLIAEGRIEPTKQKFQAPGGATTEKVIYKIYYHYTYSLGQAVSEPQLIADFIVDKNGHILPYVRFQGGELSIASDALRVLGTLSQ